MKSVNLAPVQLDLKQLLGGESFLFPCTLTRHGIGVKITALIDTGAEGHAFIDRNCARAIQQKLGL